MSTEPEKCIYCGKETDPWHQCNEDDVETYKREHAKAEDVEG